MADGEDFKINIGLDVAGAGGGTQGTAGTEAIASGTSKGMKLAGVVGILASLKVVTDTIAVTLGLISVGIVSVVGFLGTLLGLFITKVIAFFEDPFRTLIKLGVFIVNGIIAGLELVLNSILGVFGIGGVELPRFQETLVLEAYDEFKLTMVELADEGKTFSTEAIQASIDYMKGIGQSFITNTEFQEIMQERIESNQVQTEQGLDTADAFAESLINGFSTTGANFTPAFDAMGKVAQLIIDKSNEVARKLESGARFSSLGLNVTTFDPNRVSEKRLESGRYLLNKIGGA